MKFPPIPTGPITLALNGFIVDTVLKNFAEKFLPAFQVEITSSYRTPDQNEAAQGAQYSAHLYNLARDFVLKDNKGNYVPANQLEQIYNEFIKPNWEGYSYYNPPKTGETGWVHVNLNRELTNKTKIAELAVTATSIILGLKKFTKHFK